MNNSEFYFAFQFEISGRLLFEGSDDEIKKILNTLAFTLRDEASKEGVVDFEIINIKMSNPELAKSEAQQREYHSQKNARESAARFRRERELLDRADPPKEWIEPPSLDDDPDYYLANIEELKDNAIRALEGD